LDARFYAADEQVAIAKVIDEFKIEPQHQGRLVAQQRG
jgi:hypothetical protein